MPSSAASSVAGAGQILALVVVLVRIVVVLDWKGNYFYYFGKRKLTNFAFIIQLGRIPLEVGSRADVRFSFTRVEGHPDRPAMFKCGSFGKFPRFLRGVVLFIVFQWREIRLLDWNLIDNVGEGQIVREAGTAEGEEQVDGTGIAGSQETNFRLDTQIRYFGSLNTEKNMLKGDKLCGGRRGKEPFQLDCGYPGGNRTPYSCFDGNGSRGPTRRAANFYCYSRSSF